CASLYSGLRRCRALTSATGSIAPTLGGSISFAWSLCTNDVSPLGYPAALSGENSGVLSYVFFSSRRRHTRLVSDWSSDVCSSDLSSRIMRQMRVELPVLRLASAVRRRRNSARNLSWDSTAAGGASAGRPANARHASKIGRASCREKGGGSEGAGAGRQESSKRRS